MYSDPKMYNDPYMMILFKTHLQKGYYRDDNSMDGFATVHHKTIIKTKQVLPLIKLKLFKYCIIYFLDWYIVSKRPKKVNQFFRVFHVAILWQK